MYQERAFLVLPQTTSLLCAELSYHSDLVLLTLPANWEIVSRYANELAYSVPKARHWWCFDQPVFPKSA